MRHFALCLLGLIVLPVPPALADACRNEIAALYQGGALDPFGRPKRREITMSVQPDGTQALITDVMWEAVTRSITKSGANHFLTYDRQMWMGPSFDGPWTPSPSALPEDFEAMTRAQADENAANLSETACMGEMSFGGQRLRRYAFRTHTDKTARDSWFGGYHTVSINADTGQMVRMEIREMVSSWAPEPTKHMHVTTVDYDVNFAVTPPQ